jgi:ankyrin repeat protein
MLKQFQKQLQGSSEDRLELLSSVYEQAMERINGQQAGFQLQAKKVLSWITCAKRPLTTAELLHALGVEVGESNLDEDNVPWIEDIVSVCAGLVTVDKESSIVRLVHYTTQEYLQQTQKRWFPDAETNITEICITYLSFDVFGSGFCQNDEEFEERSKSNCFYNYASHNWGHHARKAFVLIPDVFYFLERKAQVEASSQVLLTRNRWEGYSQNFPKKMTGLHLAAYFGIVLVIERLLEKGADAAAADGYRRTPLHWASRKGHVDVVERLLKNGANIEAADKYGETPLFSASKNGHVNVVKHLLGKGANVEAADQYGETPLYWASKNGHVDLVKLLLEKGADVEAADGRGWTPLFLESKNGHVDAVERLLEKGANSAAVDKYGETPLHWASENGHIDVVKLLLKNGADVEAADKYGRTAWQGAYEKGHLDIIVLLFEKEINGVPLDVDE